MARNTVIFFLIFGLAFSIGLGGTNARTESANYVIWADVFSGGGLDASTSTSYTLQDTIGEAIILSATVLGCVLTYELARRVPGLSVNAEEMPAHATVITEEQIARSGARSTVQVLQQLAGVSVLDVRGMGLGSDGGVNLRGVANSSRTGALVLVDGVVDTPSTRKMMPDKPQRGDPRLFNL